jgi:hypothetical protein
MATRWSEGRRLERWLIFATRLATAGVLVFVAQSCCPPRTLLYEIDDDASYLIEDNAPPPMPDTRCTIDDADVEFSYTNESGEPIILRYRVESRSQVTWSERDELLE